MALVKVANDPHVPQPNGRLSRSFGSPPNTYVFSLIPPFYSRQVSFLPHQRLLLSLFYQLYLLWLNSGISPGSLLSPPESIYLRGFQDHLCTDDLQLYYLQTQTPLRAPGL